MVLQMCPMCSTEYPIKDFCTVDIKVGWKGNIVHLCKGCAKQLLELDSFLVLSKVNEMSENHYEHQMWCAKCKETRTFKLDVYGHEAIHLKCENCGHLIRYIRYRREVTNEEVLEYLQRSE